MTDPAKVETRVLLADDEEPLRRALARSLTRRGHVVIEACNGRDAAEKFAASTFDVVVSDIMMPDQDGIQLLKAVRLRDLDVPVVLMTGAPNVETAMQAVEFGALQYLTKPIELATFTETVERAITLHRVARAKREALALLGHGAGQLGDRAGLEASFSRALETLWMAYQPIVRVSDRALFGYEALLRSTEPTLPHPGAMLDAADRLDRLHEMGRVIRARAAAPLGSASPEALLFVNLHSADLLDPSLASPDAPLSARASRVVLEITERAALDDVKDARKRVALLREMGFRIAIDDLGAGYAGLTSFATLEPDIVKLDMSLVRGIGSSGLKQKLVGALASLCRDLGKLVVAEGVETAEERDAVIALGCDLLQGYLLAKPGEAFPAFTW